MSFSKEDLAAWNDSEVMKELEKLAKDGEFDELFDDNFKPVKFDEEEDSWEDETEELIEATEEFLNEKDENDIILENKEKEELEESVASLISGLTKISYDLADNNCKNEAYMVEKTIDDLKILLNGDSKWQK